MSNIDIEKFTNKYIETFPLIKKCILSGDDSVLTITNNILGELSEYIDIQYTYGEINHNNYNWENCNSKDIIEIYISPKMHTDNCDIMSTVQWILSNKLTSDKVNVIKYRPFIDNMFDSIECNDITVNYKDFKIHTSVGIDVLGNHVLNICIAVAENIIGKILEKRTVSFENVKNSSRDVYLPINNIVNVMIDNIIGECNLLNFVGYIEFMPLNAEDMAKLDDLSQVRDDMKLIHKTRKLNYCHVCRRNNMQKYLFKCSVCKDTRYCSMICQKLDWDGHRKICS